jgi:hypothetical protein
MFEKKTKIKVLSRIPEHRLEETLQKWTDEGWHWWPQAFNSYTIFYNKKIENEYKRVARIFWSFILTKEE